MTRQKKTAPGGHQIELMPSKVLSKAERKGVAPYCFDCGRVSKTTGSYGPPLHGLDKQWFCGPHSAAWWKTWRALKRAPTPADDADPPSPG